MKIADTDQMFIRAYVTSAQLQQVKIGDGTVTWISSRSEFTPKTILTDDERADLVYAVKIGVKNNGTIKIGMYGEVKF